VPGVKEFKPGQIFDHGEPYCEITTSYHQLA